MFYGRAVLLNLIDAGPQHLRPAIFRSLLHEACDRIINPIYGAAGLLCNGTWQLCQAAVEAVLEGAPIVRAASASASASAPPGLRTYDIWHVTKTAANSRDRFKRTGFATKSPGLPRPVQMESRRASSYESDDTPDDGRTLPSESTTVEATALSDGEPDDKAESREEDAGVGLDLILGLVLAVGASQPAVQPYMRPVDLRLRLPA
ncbi:hypothetical protein OPV22_034895 [Ensete ventricosum]|uniref:LOB domain-containing protein n=1 Tax=Ensete ventricosum TaxID=4639 RepID=A0AAV8NZU2_ENSVE|nr:hypothetical protein OPV22_034895 [Ensete ventricosum]